MDKVIKEHVLCRIQECYLANELLKDYLLDELYDDKLNYFENYKSCDFCSFGYRKIFEFNKLIKEDLELREKKLFDIALKRIYLVVTGTLLILSFLTLCFILV